MFGFSGLGGTDGERGAAWGLVGSAVRPCRVPPPGLLKGLRLAGPDPVLPLCLFFLQRGQRGQRSQPLGPRGGLFLRQRPTLHRVNIKIV